MNMSANARINETDADRPERILNLVQRDTLKTRIYREVRNALLAGHFDPGEAITVRRLAEELGAGAMPIRESLQRLVAEGALINLPNGRVQVPTLTAGEFDELKEIRLRLEGYAAARAATQRNEKDLETIKVNHDRLMDLLANEGEWSKITEANRAFHFSVYEASGAIHLLSIIDSLWLRVGPLLAFPFKVSMEVRAAYLTNLGLHSDLMTAVRDRDSAAAETAICEILSGSAAWYQRHYRFSR